MKYLSTKYLGALLAGILFPVGCLAGIGSGKVEILKLDIPNQLLMARVTTITGQPSCVNWHHHLVMKYTGTEEQKAYFSLLLAAYSSGQNVRIVGGGSCVSGTGAEVMRDIEITAP